MGAGRSDLPGELPHKYKVAITVVVMSITTCAGFLYQQRLIRQRYTDEDLDLYVRVKRIRERELEAIAAANTSSLRNPSERDGR